MHRYLTLISLCFQLFSCSQKEHRLQKERHALLNRILDSVDRGADALIVEDGVLMLSNSKIELRKLSADQLSSVRFIDYKEAKTLYGSEAKPLTLLINTYDQQILKHYKR